MNHRSPIWQFRLSDSFLIDLALQVKFVSKAPAWSHSGLCMDAVQGVHPSVDREGAGEGATLLELVSRGRQTAGQFFGALPVLGAGAVRAWGRLSGLGSRDHRARQPRSPWDSQVHPSYIVLHEGPMCAVKPEAQQLSFPPLGRLL